MKERTNQIHEELKILVQKQREVLAKVLDHLSELNRRKGFLEFGHPSLMKYCVKELGMSESAAYRRIKALRIVERSPQVKDKLKRGDLNLGQVAKAEELFQDFRHDTGDKVPDYRKIEILEKVENKDSRSTENEIRKQLGMQKKERVISIKVSDASYNKWIEFKGSMAHKNMSEEMLLCFAIEKARCVADPSRKIKARPHNPGSRYIPAHIKREVLKKANFKCAWPGCSSTYALEIDHIIPVSKGGKTERENLRLLCRNHNQARNFN